MATYGTDLAYLQDGSANDSDGESSGVWYELTATNWNVGDNPAAETDYFIQGQGCQSSDTNNKTGICSGVFDCGSDQSGLFATGDCMFIWHVLLPGNAMDTYASNGIMLIVAASLTAFDWWVVGGRDKGRNPYGGWQNLVVDPTRSPTGTVGGGNGGSWRYFGAATTVTSNINKGTMHGWDAIRYGRGEIYATGTGATFSDMATYNDYNDAVNGYNRLGLFSYQNGSYLWKGLMSLGQSGTSVTFSDSNATIFIDDTPQTYTAFNRIEINNSSSSVTWSNISLTALGTLSPGQLEVVDNATVTFDACSFSSMDTFAFQTNSSVTSCVFNQCNTITAGGGIFTGTRVLQSSVAADTSALIWNVNVDTDGYLDDMTFSKGTNSHHAIELGTTSPTEVTLRGLTFTNFSASNGQTNSVVHVKRTSGAVTINAVGCTGTVSYKSDGANVTVVVDPVTLSVHVEDIETGTAIIGARVLAYVTSAAGGYPYQDSVSLSRIGSIVTVSHTGHGLLDNDSVLIEGAVETEYNGAHQITISGVDYYTYTITGTPTSPATGSPVSTFAVINGYTGAGGNISASKSYSANQPFAGRVRYASYPASGLYKSSPITGTIDSLAGLSVTVLMIPDA